MLRCDLEALAQDVIHLVGALYQDHRLRLLVIRLLRWRAFRAFPRLLRLRESGEAQARGLARALADGSGGLAARRMGRSRARGPS